jgi:hypothetical protein
LLNEDALGVFEQSAFHKEQSAIVFEAVDQDYVFTVEVIASLTPFQLFVESGRETKIAQRSKFGAPAFLLAVDLTDKWIHEYPCTWTPPLWRHDHMRLNYAGPRTFAIATGNRFRHEVRRELKQVTLVVLARELTGGGRAASLRSGSRQHGLDQAGAFCGERGFQGI